MRVSGTGAPTGLVPRLPAAAVPPTARGGATDRPVTPTERVSGSREQLDAPPLAHETGDTAQAATATSTHWPAPALQGLIGHRLLYEVQRQAQLVDGVALTADRATDAIIAYRAASDLSAMVLRPDGAGLRQPFRV